MIYFSKKPSASDLVAGEKDWVKIILYVTLIFNLIAITCYWFGHILYVIFTGKFYGAFDFLYLMFHSISESVLTTMLIFIAFGWTITFIEDAEFDLYIPLRKISMLDSEYAWHYKSYLDPTWKNKRWILRQVSHV